MPWDWERSCDWADVNFQARCSSSTLSQGSMARRSPDFGEAVIGLTGSLALLAYFTPALRPLLALVFVVAVVLGGWFLFRTFFGTFRWPSQDADRVHRRVPTPTLGATGRRPGVREAPRKQWSSDESVPDVDAVVRHLRALDWFQFESAMGVLFGHIGYKVRRKGGANPDGGIDLELTRGTERSAVQCKHWTRGEVGVETIRGFLGAMVDAGIARGILIGSAGFTGPARELAARHGVEILDEEQVARGVLAAGGWRDPLFRSAFVAPPKLCPKCGSPLVERVARRGKGIGRSFYGCARYPRCTQTMPG